MDVAELRRLFIFEGVGEDQLGDLLAVADEVPFAAEQELFREGEPADHWWVLLEGRVQLVRQAGREQAVVMLTMERPGVWAGGFRAWNAESSYLATGRGAEAGRMMRVPSAELGRLARSWFPFGVHLIEGFFQTVRSMDSLSRQRESLIALGTLAAGLAHEMNNPASAATRAVDALRETTDAIVAALVHLAEAGLLAEQFVALEDIRRDIVTPDPAEGSLAVADREEVLAGWLERHGVEQGWELAPALAATSHDIAWADQVAELLPGPLLEPGLRWVSGTLAVRALLTDVKESTARISALVDAVKSYSQMDRASSQQIDVTDGIESTLVMLAHKLPADVVIVRDYAVDLPPIDARPGELNQVWTNLIDNAVDAMDGAGTLTISTRVEPQWLVVDIGDTGSGMPAAVAARAFEPFYTTKDVGKGTGLGLDISRRIIVDRHGGQISIDSSPHGTVMHVALPRRPE
jgi:signal transduction histidine kinase